MDREDNKDRTNVCLSSIQFLWPIFFIKIITPYRGKETCCDNARNISSNRISTEDMKLASSSPKKQIQDRQKTGHDD